MAAENARRKALAVRDGDRLVLGADTLVAVDGHILGKPATPRRRRRSSGGSPAARIRW